MLARNERQPVKNPAVLRPPKFILMRACAWFCTFAGMYMFAQGLSFAVPHGDEGGAEFILRLDAKLISAGGFGLFAAGLLLGHIVSLLQRIWNGERSSEDNRFRDSKTTRAIAVAPGKR
jgi:hypothetical protein